MKVPATVNSNWLSAAKREVVLEIIRQGEARVNAQIDLAKASDARAVGILTAGSALAAGAAAVLGTTSGQASPVTWAAMYAIGGFMLSSCHAAISAWPRDVQPLGWNPDAFADDVRRRRSMNIIYSDIANSLERRLTHNNIVIATCGRHTKASIIGLPLTAGFSSLIALLTSAVPKDVLFAFGISSTIAAIIVHLAINGALIRTTPMKATTFQN